MRATMRVAFAISVSITFGTMIFFTASVAPTLFSVLSLNSAGRVLDELFPIYYTLTGLLCVIAFITAFWLYAQRPPKRARIIQSLVGITTLLTLIAWLIILPRMADLTSRIPTFAGPRTPLINQFFMYHGISMLFNLIGIIALLIVIALWASSHPFAPINTLKSEE